MAPSIHARVLVTWLAIFPMVAIALGLVEVLASEWPSLLKAFVLSTIIVPLAVYLVVPFILVNFMRLELLLKEFRNRRGH